MTLRAVKVSKSFGKTLVIREATLEIPPGKATLLSGPSGIGKSTLLEILAGLVKPGSGRVERDLPISLMPQDNALVPWLSSFQNLAYAAPRGLKKAEKHEKISYWLDFFEIPAGSFPHELSGGMRRRLALARTFFPERPVVLLDEPFAFLDEKWIQKVLSLVAEKIGEGAAAALAAHGHGGLIKEALGERLVAKEIKKSPVCIPEEGPPEESGG